MRLAHNQLTDQFQLMITAKLLLFKELAKEHKSNSAKKINFGAAIWRSHC